MGEKTYSLPRDAAGALGGAGRPAASDPQDTSATLLVIVLAVAILYLARAILVPIAIAVLLSFAMSPLVKLLRRVGLGKGGSVGLVVFLAFLIAVGLGLGLARQVSDLAAQAPRLERTVALKLDTMRTLVADSSVLAKVNDAMAVLQPPRGAAADTRKGAADIGAAVSPDGAAADAAKGGAVPGGTGKAPTPVEVVTPAPGPLAMLQAAIGYAASPLATAAFVAIYIVFILLQREDLRNRLIRLAGSDDLQRTTLALNDAARRLSRYLLAQLLLNTGFGAVVGIGLAVIGVPSPLLWAIVAAFMRFIPYVGIVGGAAAPLLLAAAADPGWGAVVETAAFFAVIEFVTGQMIEPLVFGRNTGISPIAVVLSATFWTWLWGPVGLVLSTPLTVCLVVMGRHVRRFSFLDVLLGDAPALTEVELFYQRMLAGDPSEILDHADRFLQSRTLLDYCDAVAMPALMMAQGDVRRGALDEARQQRLRDTMRLLAHDLADREEAAAEERGDAEPATPVDPGWAAEGAVLCFAARSSLDEAAAHLLGDVLREHGIGVRVRPVEALLRDAADAAGAAGTRLAVLSFFDADHAEAQAKVALHRLRRRLPDIPVLAAFWTSGNAAAGVPDAAHRPTRVGNLPDAVRFCLAQAAVQPRDAAAEGSEAPVERMAAG